MTLLIAALFIISMMSSSSHAFTVIDSHLHIWATAEEASSNFPYAGEDQTPPSSLQNEASPEKLLEQMNAAKVDGALIVQPINHKYDHSYVTNAIKKYPNKFKGMLLHDPSLPSKLAVQRLEELVLLAGYVGVRFNPYLWSEGELMSSEAGLDVYKRCGELKIPVGIMCFKGLQLHIEDIQALLSKSPDTVMILDHMGFCALNDEGDEAFKLLLGLAKQPNVYVKISALFRNIGDNDSFPYNKVKSMRFDPLLDAYGADRLMMGSDFPFVLETKGGYKGAVETVQSWVDGSDREAVMGGTAKRLFGSWAS